VIQVFPMPILGVLLLFEALTLGVLIRDLHGSRMDFFVAVLVGLIAVYVPYGYLAGMVAGVLILAAARRGWLPLGGVPGQGDAGRIRPAL